MRHADKPRPTLPQRICSTFAFSCLVIATGCAAEPRGSVALPATMPLATSRPAALALTVLGSGGPGADGRASTCFVLSLDGTPRIMVDAGSGAFVRLGE